MKMKIDAWIGCGDQCQLEGSLIVIMTNFHTLFSKEIDFYSFITVQKGVHDMQ